MKKLIAILITCFVIMLPMPANGADVCVPGVSVPGVIKLGETCIKVDTPVTTNPPKSSSPPKAPSRPKASTSKKKSSSKALAPRRGTSISPNTTSKEDKAEKKKVDKAKDNKRPNQVSITDYHKRTPEEMEDARRDLAFWFFSIMAFVGVMYLIFYRKKDPYRLDRYPPLR